MVSTLWRVNGEYSGRCACEQLTVELMDFATFVDEREADRAIAGEGQVIRDKTIVLNGDVYRLHTPIAAGREAGHQQDKWSQRAIGGTVAAQARIRRRTHG